MANLEAEVERVNALVDRLAVHQAADLARAGAHANASALLADLLERAPNMVHALDLQAKVHAQQGQFEAARDCWKRVLQLDPGHASASAGIAKIDSLRRYPVWMFWAMPAALTALVVACVLVMSLGAAESFHQDRDLILSQVRSDARVRESVAARVSQKLDSLEAKAGAVQTAQGRTGAALQSLPRIEAALAAEKSARRSLEQRLDKMSRELTKLRQERRPALRR